VSIKLTCETVVTIDAQDVCAMLTESLCNSYGAFSGLEAYAISLNEDGDFVINLIPTAPEVAEAENPS